jgi:hypothetical protein
MAKPTIVARLQVWLTDSDPLPDDAPDAVFDDVGYFTHGEGLDIVDPANGEYVKRYLPHEFLRYEGLALSAADRR